MPLVLEFTRDGQTHTLGAWCDEAEDLARDMWRQRWDTILAGEIQVDTLTLWRTAGDGTRLYWLVKFTDPALISDEVEPELEFARRSPGGD